MTLRCAANWLTLRPRGPSLRTPGMLDRDQASKVPSVAASVRAARTMRRDAVPACSLALVSALMAWSACPSVAADARPQRILLLEGQSATQPGGVRTFEAFRARLKEKSRQTYEIDFDHLDLARFPGATHAERAARYLGEKHAQKPLDLVVPNGRGSLSVLLRYRDLIAPNVPIVYCCVTPAVADSLNLPGDAVGVTTEYDWAATLALAERLQPGAKNLVIISGASEADRAWEAEVRKGIEPRLDRYHVQHFLGLPRDELAQGSVASPARYDRAADGGVRGQDRPGPCSGRGRAGRRRRFRGAGLHVGPGLVRQRGRRRVHGQFRGARRRGGGSGARAPRRQGPGDASSANQTRALAPSRRACARTVRLARIRASARRGRSVQTAHTVGAAPQRACSVGWRPSDCRPRSSSCC